VRREDALVECFRPATDYRARLRRGPVDSLRSASRRHDKKRATVAMTAAIAAAAATIRNVAVCIFAEHEYEPVVGFIHAAKVVASMGLPAIFKHIVRPHGRGRRGRGSAGAAATRKMLGDRWRFGQRCTGRSRAVATTGDTAREAPARIDARGSSVNDPLTTRGQHGRAVLRVPDGPAFS
jgi:hypothetical protein